MNFQDFLEKANITTGECLRHPNAASRYLDKDGNPVKYPVICDNDQHLYTQFLTGYKEDASHYEYHHVPLWMLSLPEMTEYLPGLQGGAPFSMIKDCFVAAAITAAYSNSNKMNGDLFNRLFLYSSVVAWRTTYPEHLAEATRQMEDDLLDLPKSKDIAVSAIQDSLPDVFRPDYAIQFAAGLHALATFNNGQMFQFLNTAMAYGTNAYICHQQVRKGAETLGKVS